MADLPISVFEHDSLEYDNLPEQKREQIFNWLVDELVPSVVQDKESPNWVTLRHKGGKAVSVKFHNYVGVVATPFGEHIEILPKSIGVEKVEQGRRLLLDMLCCLREFRHIVTEQALVQTERLPLLEVFIKVFLQSTLNLVKRGLRNAYVPEEDNLPTLRGRLAFAEHLRQNICRKDRFFVRHDEFSPNRPENRLLRKALDLCRSLTAVHGHLARQLCDHFDTVPPSSNVKLDFQRVHIERDMQNYNIPLAWARLILENMTPLGGKGDFHAPSLLFPMEKLFEAFVAHKLRGMLQDSFRLQTQARSCHLIAYKGSPCFQMKPDMLIKNSAGDNVLVLDTKWKIVNEKEDKFGISQADLYQMYAYGQSYLGGKGEMTLIYPKTDTFQTPSDVFKLVDCGGRSFGKLKLWAVPFDLTPGNYRVLWPAPTEDEKNNFATYFATTPENIP